MNYGFSSLYENNLRRLESLTVCRWYGIAKAAHYSFVIFTSGSGSPAGIWMTRGLPLGRSIGFRTTVSRIEESVADPDPQEIRGRPCLKKKKKIGGPFGATSSGSATENETTMRLNCMSRPLHFLYILAFYVDRMFTVLWPLKLPFIIVIPKRFLD